MVGVEQARLVEMFESFLKITIKVSRREPFLFNRSGKILLEKDQKTVFTCPCAGFMCLIQP